MTWSGRRSFAGIVACVALGVRLARRGFGRRRNAAAARDRAAAGHRDLVSVRRRRPQLVPEDLREGRLRRGGVPRQRQGQRLHVAGARPGRRAHAERAVHDAHPRAPAREGLALQRQRRRRDAQPVQPVRPQHRLGARAPPVHAQRRRLGRHHRQADRRRGAEELRPRALRLAVVREPAAARRPAQLPSRRSRPSTRRPRSRTTEDGLVWDIYSQVGAWCAAATRSNPLAYGSGATARRHRRRTHVYGFGYSQTGGYLYDYINAIHPLVVAADGAADLRRLHRRRRRRRASSAPCRSTSASRRRRPATRACSSTTSACRSSTSCPSRTT